MTGVGVVIHLGVFALTCCLGQIVAGRLFQTVTIKKNLELASSVQELLLPKKREGTFCQFDFSTKYDQYGKMAGDWMNFWDYSIVEKRLIFGDVIGKGPRAALAVASIAAFIESSKNAGDSMDECITRINTGLFQLFDGQLTTTFSGIVMFEDGHVEVYNCGGVGWTQIKSEGYKYFTMRSSVLGMDTPLRIGHEMINAESGDVLFAFTDGVLEGNKAVSRMIKPRYWFEYVDTTPFHKWFIDFDGEQLVAKPKSEFEKEYFLNRRIFDHENNLFNKLYRSYEANFIDDVDHEKNSNKLRFKLRRLLKPKQYPSLEQQQENKRVVALTLYWENEIPFKILKPSVYLPQ